MPGLTRQTVEGVTLLAGTRAAGGVTLAFTERSGGVSEPPFASLNLGDACGDDPSAVGENRLRALRAIGAGELASRLVNPRQVHGDTVVCVTDGSADSVARAQAEAREGADAVVVTAADVPVLLCFADCVPVVLSAPGGFAVVHSGWRGTIARIAGKAAAILAEQAGCKATDIRAAVGPHIGVGDYGVSHELAERFRTEFGSGAATADDHLDLAFCVREALKAAGVPADAIEEAGVSTASATDRFFSYRAEGGECGRHGALAVLRRS